MTILGKILVFVVLVLSLLWTFLTASAFSARTNWQATAKRYQDEAQKAATAATAMKAQLDAEREASLEQVRVIREDRDRYASTTDLITKDREKLLTQYNELLEATKKQSAEAAPLIGQKEKLIAEVGLKDEQIRAKDAEINQLTLVKEAAVVKAGERTLEAAAQTARANRLADQVQTLQEALAARGAAGQARPGQPAGPRSPAPAGFRASVVSAQAIGGEVFVTINQGLDAGLQKNTELTVQRLSGGGQYLGRLVITEVNPKDAVGKFVIPNRRPTAADYPRAGDTVTGGS
jgi:hypothetical protein